MTEDNNNHTEIEDFMVNPSDGQPKMMKCTEIREKLSEYIDDFLDPETNRLLKQHLLECNGCRAEYATLRTLVDDLGSLGTVKPPTDFLEQLHGRMASKFRLRKIIQKLFFPWQLKIPLELATVMIVILALYLGSAKFGVREEVHHLKDPEDVTVAKAPDSGPLEARQEESDLTDKLGVTALVKTPQSKPDRKPIELALLLDKDKMETSRFEKRERPALSRGVPGLEEGVDAKLSRFDGVGSKVIDLIESVKGRVVSIEHKKQGKGLQSIYAEIPGRHFGIFTEELRQLANLQTPPPNITGMDQETIPVHISFKSLN